MVYLYEFSYKTWEILDKLINYININNSYPNYHNNYVLFQLYKKIIRAYKSGTISDLLLEYLNDRCPKWKDQDLIVDLCIQIFWIYAKRGFIYNSHIVVYYDLEELKSLVATKLDEKSIECIERKYIINKNWHDKMNSFAKKVEKEKHIFYDPWWIKQKNNYLEILSIQNYRKRFFEFLRDFPEEIPGLEEFYLGQF